MSRRQRILRHKLVERKKSSTNTNVPPSIRKLIGFIIRMWCTWFTFTAAMTFNGDFHLIARLNRLSFTPNWGVEYLIPDVWVGRQLSFSFAFPTQFALNRTYALAFASYTQLKSHFFQIKIGEPSSNARMCSIEGIVRVLSCRSLHLVCDCLLTAHTATSGFWLTLNFSHAMLKLRIKGRRWERDKRSWCGSLALVWLIVVRVAAMYMRPIQSHWNADLHAIGLQRLRQTSYTRMKIHFIRLRMLWVRSHSRSPLALCAHRHSKWIQRAQQALCYLYTYTSIMLSKCIL